MGACVQDDAGFIPSAASAIQRRLVGRNAASHRRWSGDWQEPMRGGEGGKVAGEPRATQKMLKMKVDPEMSMKTKDRMTK